MTWNTPKPALGTSLGSGIPVAASMVVSQGPSGVSSYVSSYFGTNISIAVGYDGGADNNGYAIIRSLSTDKPRLVLTYTTPCL